MLSLLFRNWNAERAVVHRMAHVLLEIYCTNCSKIEVEMERHPLGIHVDRSCATAHQHQQHQQPSEQDLYYRGVPASAVQGCQR